VRFYIIFVFLIFLNSDSCFANGFKILGVKSTKATAMGEAFIVQADNPSAIAFNPAGLTQLEDCQVSVEGTLTNGWVRHTSPGGDKEAIRDKWQLIPAFYFTSDLGTENIAAGIGITLPNGMSSEWRENGFARYVATFSELILVDINPSAAYKFNEYLSAGAGISYYYSTATLESRVDYGRLIGLPGAFDGRSKLEGTGDAWGYNAGVLCKLNDKHGLAVTFKSPFTVRYDGDVKYSSIPGFLGLGSDLKYQAKTSIDFPAVIVFGYAWRPIDGLKLEFNLDWTQWEVLDSLLIDFKDQSQTDIVYQYEYKNTFAYKFGAEYAVDEKLELRAGYIFNENAVPEENWKPSLPDTDSHFICSGLGYRMGCVTVDGAAQMILYKDRTIDNNVDNNEATASSIDGKYENIAVVFSLGVTYKF
jgi:long-chain fatty acid transport protein